MPENTDILEALIYLATIKATAENATLGQIIKFLEFFLGILLSVNLYKKQSQPIRY